MRAHWLIILMPVAAHAAGVELEVAPGYAWSTDVSASAPVLRGRLGVEYPWFTPSIVGVGAFLSPGPLTHYSQRGGWTGWGLAAEVRFHTEGENRFVAALGGGWGQLSTLQAENGDDEGYQGRPAPYVQAAIGYQRVFGQLRLGIELTLDIFNRVNREGDIGVAFCADVPGSGFVMQCPTGRSFPIVGLALTVGFAP